MQATITIKYHIFADNEDQWTDSLLDAAQVARQFHHQGQRNIRIYTEEYENFGKEDEEMVSEDCIWSMGEYPY